VRTLVRRLAAAAVLVLAGLVYLELAWPPFYDFAPPEPFRGERWYNPYAGYRGGGLLANFHAHSEAWSGLTFGDTPARQLHDIYKARGYDLIGISDYMGIEPPQDPNELYLSAYEHGFTPGRHHQTVIGAKHVDWFDYPLGSSTRQKQSVIDSLRRSAAFLVLNHPTKADSYAIADMDELSGYDAIEIATKYGVWDDFWDAALSAGRPVWGFAADDGHAQTEEGAGSHVGIGALVIHAQRNPDSVLEALRAGRFHALFTRQNEGPITLEYCEIDAGVLRVRVGEPADLIRFYGEHGQLRSEARRKPEAVYTLRPDDPYVRIEITAHHAVLYLNPVIRWDGVALPRPQAALRPAPTWGTRAGGGLVLALVWVGIARLGLRAPSQSVGAPEPERNST
jgi:hypothetical protein